jgi:hypothetical protein
VNLAALLVDINKLLAKASSASGSTKIPTAIGPATRRRTVREIKSPTVDVWTGSSDKTLRKLEINLTLPVSGTASRTLGGMTSAALGVILQYEDVNQPQTVAAPTNVRPFSQFEAKARSFVGQLQTAFGTTASTGSTGSAGATGSAGSTGSAGATGTAGATGSAGATGATVSAGSSAKVRGYSLCLQQAGTDVTKMQKCAPLLNG